MSAKILEKDSGPGDRIGIAELLGAVASKVRDNRKIGVCSEIDVSGVFVAVYVPNGEIESSEIVNSLSGMLQLVPECKVPLERGDKAITKEDESRLVIEQSSFGPNG